MPNLNFITTLREQYDREQPDRYSELNEFLVLSEAKKIAIKEAKKGTDKHEALRIEGFDIDKPELVKYFEKNPEEQVVLLYIDITDFSVKFSHLENSEIESILSEYYKKTIPLIYKHGGEIEKIMGDGIIAVFGRPFLKDDLVEICKKAESCAAEIIKKNYGTQNEVKIAIHTGKVMYYSMPLPNSEEYTIIGNVITELYRLESVSENNSLNFYEGTLYWGLVYLKRTEMSKPPLAWLPKSFQIELKGIGVKKINCFQWH